MAGSECWATVASDAEEAVKVLVLAKGLRRLMTARKLVLFASPQLPDDVWELLQSEFDAVLRLERRWVEKGVHPHLVAKVMAHSSKWGRVVFLSPETLVVQACDEIFKKQKTFSSPSGDVMIIQPAVTTWRKLEEVLRKEPTIDERTLFSDTALLDEKFCVPVNLKNELMAKNLKDVLITRFVGNHPMEILCREEGHLVQGTMENGLLKFWQEQFDHGVVQKLVQMETGNFNGLKNYLDKYRSARPESFRDSMKEVEELKDSIAIVGTSFRFPGANNMDEFWKLLIEERDAICLAPEGRWSKDRNPTLPDDAKNSHAGFLNIPVDEFDGKFFGISPMELEFMDPQQRLTLQVAWEALEDAGINPTSLNRTYTGVFGGEWRTDYREALQTAGAGEAEFFRCYLGNSVGVLTARISHCLGLTGPSVATESGCSSSIVAVDLACKSLLRRETDLSLACGVNLLIHPFTGKTMNTVLAPDGHSKTFDENADGFGRAEGCAVLVLKRYSDAMRDGDRVWGLIRGSAVVQEGASKSLGTPTKYCEALAMQLALEQANVKAKDVSYVETHGTGTPVGDPLEVAAVGQVYGEDREDKLIIGSVKTNIGHTESCSGIAGIIKVVLSMQHEIIPAHVNFKTLNPAIDLDSIPAQIPIKAMEWKRDPTGQKPRIAGVSSFGITGTDAHVIIQEPPKKNYPVLLKSPSTRPCQILTLSAKNEETLEENISQFKQFLVNTEDVVEDIVRMANVGKGSFLHRAAVVGSTKAEILDKLGSQSILIKVAPEETPKICFLFTGQGSQYPGMAKSLYEHSQVFKMHFDRCDFILKEDYGIDIKNALWGSNTSNLSRTIYSQTSIFVVEYCLLQLWDSWGVKPDFVLGHSLGEFAAAVGGGILSFEDALKLVAERSRLIDALPRGKMMVLKENKDQTDILLKAAFEGNKGWLDYAAVNSPEQTVVAGSEENILAFAEFCKNNKIKTHVLDATHAFHSRHMDPILEKYRKISETVNYQKPTCTYVSGMEGRVVEESEGIHVNADYWVRHTRDSVRFASAAKAIMGTGCSLFLEVGPQPVLSALTMINSDGVELSQPLMCLPSVRKQEEDWPCILNTVAKLYGQGVQLQWDGFYQFESFKKCTIPFYPFHKTQKSHWFEIPDRGPGQIHPLVGTPVSNASSTKMFQNKLGLEEAEFLRDHVIGNKVIFPGAGFIEMCLVAGHSATQCTEASYFAPPGPITLTNFAIESPLGLSENEAAQLQAIVSTEENGDTKVTLYSKLVLDKETQKWIRHASGIFAPYAVQSKEEKVEINLQEKLEAFTDTVEVSDVYGKFAEFGLKFGPTFQTLKKMMRKKSNTSNNDELLFEVQITQSPERFICHPVVMDALFQAIMFSVNPSDHKLSVPVSVQKFISFSPIPENEELCYIYCKKADNGEIRASLLDQSGTILGQMDGAVLMETTVSAILSALEAQKLSLPAMYEDVWRSQFGPMEKRADLNKVLNYDDVSSPATTLEMAHHNHLSEEDLAFNKKCDSLCAGYFIKGLYDLGLSSSTPKGSVIVVKDFCAKAIVDPGLVAFVRFMFFELEKDGFFTNVDNTLENLAFKVAKPLPSHESLKTEIEVMYKSAHPMSPHEIEYIASTGTKLASFLIGKSDALHYLFPEDPNSPISAANYYMDARMCRRAHAVVNDGLSRLLKGTFNFLDEAKETIRILEVGAGTASFTKTLLGHLKGNPSNWEFTFTDISPVFFPQGKQVFEGSDITVHYKLLNIEEDPATQGFFPEHYDIIIANNVIHATKSIAATCLNLRNLLADNGLLIVAEGISAQRGTNITFGLLEAYWHYQDFELRGYNCEVSDEKWKIVLESNGYGNVTTFPCYDNKFGMIIAKKTKVVKEIEYAVPAHVVELKKTKAWWLFAGEDKQVSAYIRQYLNSLGHQAIVINRGQEFIKYNNNQYDIRSDDGSHVTKLLEDVKGNEFVLMGVIYLWGLFPCLSENIDVDSICQPFLHICKTIIPLDHPKLFVVTKCIQSVGDQEVADPRTSPLLAMTKCFQNEQPNATSRCIDLEDCSTVSHKQLQELCTEFLNTDGEIYVAYRNGQRMVPRFSPWKPPNTALGFPKAERFKLILPPSNAISDLRYGPLLTKSNLMDGELEVRIKSYALNFRDLFMVLKPSVEFEKMTQTVGIDWAGVVVSTNNTTQYQVGDAVFGTNLNGDSLPSHLSLHEDLVFPCRSMTFNEAATIPAVAATAYLCLVEIAKLTKDDTILIHTASGGVGLVAVQVAQAVGATIVATAGNRRKRAYLRGLGIQHIFNSRNTNYGQQVREALGGGGVDVVLNSLTGPGFKEASLALCNQGARFVEMSKLSTWTVEEVKAQRPDVIYTIADLSASSDEEMKSLVKNIKEFMTGDIIKPIPYCRFDASEIREALTYLQKAKHIGKIVVTMPDPDQNGLEPLFNDRSTYIITGGLGGIGMEVAKWMVQVGAKHVALIGRSPPNEKAQEEIKRMNQNDKNVFALQFDVGDQVQCQEMLERLQNPELDLPPIRGIMHAAGVLSDAIYVNQSWEKYSNTYHPKVKGGWNLHKLTRNLPLEHFVMFSSAVASMGSMGQSNHSSANFFLDSLAYYRNSMGLPATTVNWGQWGQVGVAANIEIIGLRPFTVLQGISALERAMKSQRLQTCVCDADFNMIKQIFTGVRMYMDELKLTQMEATKELVINNEQFWNDYDAAQSDESRLEVVKKFVRSMIRQILKLGKDDKMNDNENFQDMGMDSLMSIELKNALQTSMGQRASINVNTLKDCRTINELAARLCQVLAGNDDDEVPVPTREEFQALIREDAILPEHIKAPPLPPCKFSEVKTILITGATGNMGPYFLRDLSKRSHITKIYCILRQDSDGATAAVKLDKKLVNKGIKDQIDMNKIETICGHLNKPFLGLSEQEYLRLAEEVDCVIHLSVKSNFTEAYKKVDKPEAGDMRTANVKGTISILEFVTTIKTKVLLHASTIVANPKVDDDFRLSESWPGVDEFDEMPNTAYPVSKFVCDLLMAKAVKDRGLPIKVFRYPAIGGDTKTGGNVDYENNQLMLRMMSYMHLGIMPALPLPLFLMSVDEAVNLSLRVFFDDDVSSDIFNVYNPFPHNETELVLIGGELGYPVEVLDPDEFQERLANYSDTKLIHFLKEACNNKDAQTRFLKDTPAIMNAYTRNSSQAFVSKKLSKILPDIYPRGVENTLSVIKRDLHHARNTGIFQKFGI